MANLTRSYQSATEPAIDLVRLKKDLQRGGTWSARQPAMRRVRLGRRAVLAVALLGYWSRLSSTFGSRRAAFACIHERRLVDQTGASWNRVGLWLRQLESLRRVS